MGGLGGSGARTTRRQFLVGAGAAAGLLAAGCSSSSRAAGSASGTSTGATTRARPRTTAATDPDVSKYLQGAYAPVRAEETLLDLEVSGSLPRELEGLYLRNGPNPWPVPEGRYDWFTGDGMLHGIDLRGGDARWYRNRWIRTAARAERDGGPAAGGPAEPFPAPNAGNTSVVRHAGHLLALYEVGLPHELSDELDTLGRFDFGGALNGPMTAHPKLDPATGELHLFGYLPGLRYYVVDAQGALVRNEAIALPQITMMHDFSLTERHVVFYDLPVVFDAALLERSTLPFSWQPAAGARVGVMPRDGTAADLVWAEVEPAFLYHTLGAWDLDDGSGVALDVVRHDSAFTTLEQIGSPVPPTLHRWTVDLTTKRVREEQLHDRPVEFPKADLRLTGRQHRYGYGVALAGEGDDANDFAPFLLQSDLDRGRTVEHRFPDGSVPGEPTFVPGGDGAGEDEGWVLSLVLDQATGTTDLVVLDATDFSGRPVATVHLPVRVPVGFHGAWFPADSA